MKVDKDAGVEIILRECYNYFNFVLNFNTNYLIKNLNVKLFPISSRQNETYKKAEPVDPL